MDDYKPSLSVEGGITTYIVGRLRSLLEIDTEKFKIMHGGQLTIDSWINIDIYDSDIPGGKFSIIIRVRNEEIKLEVVNMIIPKDPGVSIPFSDPNAFNKAVEEVMSRINLLCRDKLRLLRKKAKKLNQEIRKTRRLLKILEDRDGKLLE